MATVLYAWSVVQVSFMSMHLFLVTEGPVSQFIGVKSKPVVPHDNYSVVSRTV